MKLIFAIVQKEDVRGLNRALVEREFSVTQMASKGGFLSGGNATLMIGIEDDKLEEVLGIIQEESHSREETHPILAVPDLNSIAIPVQVHISGATVFVVDVASFHKY